MLRMPASLHSSSNGDVEATWKAAMQASQANMRLGRALAMQQVLSRAVICVCWSQPQWVLTSQEQGDAIHDCCHQGCQDRMVVGEEEGSQTKAHVHQAQGQPDGKQGSLPVL